MISPSRRLTSKTTSNQRFIYQKQMVSLCDKVCQ
jgi:hypothetical protein